MSHRPSHPTRLMFPSFCWRRSIPPALSVYVPHLLTCRCISHDIGGCREPRKTHRLVPLSAPLSARFIHQTTPRRLYFIRPLNIHNVNIDKFSIVSCRSIRHARSTNTRRLKIFPSERSLTNISFARCLRIPRTSARCTIGELRNCT